MTVEVGDLDIFAPAVPCLLVNTWYVDGEPDSTVTYFWQDEGTGTIHYELLFNAPVPYDEAMKWADEHASKSNIKRIHVRHARPKLAGPGRAKRLVKASKAPKASAKKHASTKRRMATAGKRARKAR